MNPNTPPLNTIPQLDAEQRVTALPERVQTALDAREAEKALREQWVQECLQTLRPELERLARDVVEQRVQSSWRSAP